MVNTKNLAGNEAGASVRVGREGQDILDNYFLGMLLSAYEEFENRASHLKPGKGAKTEIVKNAIDHQIGEFTLSDILQVCPGISRETAKLAFRELAKRKKIVCLGKGKSAKWKKIA